MSQLPFGGEPEHRILILDGGFGPVCLDHWCGTGKAQGENSAVDVHPGFK